MEARFRVRMRSLGDAVGVLVSVESDLGGGAGRAALFVFDRYKVKLNPHSLQINPHSLCFSKGKGKDLV